MLPRSTDRTLDRRRRNNLCFLNLRFIKQLRMNTIHTLTNLNLGAIKHKCQVTIKHRGIGSLIKLIAFPHLNTISLVQSVAHKTIVIHTTKKYRNYSLRSSSCANLNLSPLKISIIRTDDKMRVITNTDRAN